MFNTLNVPREQPFMNSNSRVGEPSLPWDAFFEGVETGIKHDLKLNTTADLQAASIRKARYAITFGSVAAGDGGGGEFYWNASSTDTADGGTIISSNHSSVGRWYRIINESYINIRWFLALGDGNTSDVEPLRNAITACRVREIWTLYLPTGQYALDEQIDLKALLDINDTSSNQGYFRMFGENAQHTRFIPSEDITGGMFVMDNEGTASNGANGRQLLFENICWYSDSRLNKSCEYAIHLRWCTEVYFTNCLFFNIATKRHVFFDQTFVGCFWNCIFVGKSASRADGSYSEPDAVDIAYNNPPAAVEDQLCAFYGINTVTTIEFNSSRFRTFINGINSAGIDVLNLYNSAPESNKVCGLLVSGSTKNLNIDNSYWEGNPLSIRMAGTILSAKIEANFFHDATSIEFASGTDITGVAIKSNHFFSGADGIEDKGASLNHLSIYDNYFRDLSGMALVMDPDINISDRIIDVKDNAYNGTELTRGPANLNKYSIDDLTLSGATRAFSDNKFSGQNCWDLTGALSTPVTDYIGGILLNINATINNNLPGSWITIVFPVLKTGGTGGSILRVLGGATSTNFNLFMATDSWRVNRAYHYLDPNDGKIEIRLYPNGSDITVGDITVLQGLHGDTVSQETSLNSVGIHPITSNQSAISLYDFTNKDNQVIRLKNAGTPGYGVITVLDNTGTETIEVHGINGIKMHTTRFQEDKGSDSASGGNLSLQKGNYFDITGTSTINGIAIANWQAGSSVTLKFDSSPTLKHNTAAASGYASLILENVSDFIAVAGDNITLRYDGTYWRETSRTVMSGGRGGSQVRITNSDSPYSIPYGVEEIFCNTDSGNITANLQAGIASQAYRIINTGTSVNTVTVNPAGSENLIGVNSGFTLNDGETLKISFETTDHWY